MPKRQPPLFQADELVMALGLMRHNGKISNEAFAKKVPISAATLRKILRGQDAKLSTLHKVAKKLGCTVRIEIERAA